MDLRKLAKMLENETIFPAVYNPDMHAVEVYVDERKEDMLMKVTYDENGDYAIYQYQMSKYISPSMETINLTTMSQLFDVLYKCFNEPDRWLFIKSVD